MTATRSRSTSTTIAVLPLPGREPGRALPRGSQAALYGPLLPECPVAGASWQELGGRGHAQGPRGPCCGPGDSGPIDHQAQGHEVGQGYCAGRDRHRGNSGLLQLRSGEAIRYLRIRVKPPPLRKCAKIVALPIIEREDDHYVAICPALDIASRVIPSAGVAE